MTLLASGVVIFQVDDFVVNDITWLEFYKNLTSLT